MASNGSNLPWSIVTPHRFIRATRDSGYRSTASAVSELVDNAIQARARNIDIHVDTDCTQESLNVTVADNGCGMDASTLRQALRFGGSSRFDDRSGLGRFGMGLPNSSLSQARRVSATSWTHRDPTAQGKTRTKKRDFCIQTYIDLDEISKGSMIEVPRPYRVDRPKYARSSASGTVVQWTRCDRLDFRRAATICKHIDRDLAQRFRYFIQDGVSIRVNGSLVRAFDPMFLNGDHECEAVQYGNEITYRVSADPDSECAPHGLVRVRFSELPVQKWAQLSAADKRSRRIVQHAGASIVRANREIDYGWHFFGKKRRENYDDWWRCEIHFDPILDEAFGLTHTKQQIKPRPYLIDALSADIEATARELNTRARQAHASLATKRHLKKSEVIADEKSSSLQPLAEARSLRERRSVRYRIRESSLEPGVFYSFQKRRNEFVLTLDPDHSFYRDFYSRCEGSPELEAVQTAIELLLFSAARAEAAGHVENHSALIKFRSDWGKTLETLLGG